MVAIVWRFLFYSFKQNDVWHWRFTSAWKNTGKMPVPPNFILYI
jgi:hypothetical protein